MRYLTSAIPGTGGIIKESPEDFVVTEVPAYLPSGEGEHVFVHIEKWGLTTLEAMRRIAGALGAAERDMGYAGLKDARGVTRQTLSIPRVDPQRVLDLQLPGITVLSARRHRNKLKPGHLSGNSFSITVRECVGGAVDVARKVLDVLSVRGVPNCFGEQRYGSQGNSHLVGGALVRGDFQGAVETLVGDPAAVRDERWRDAIEAFRKGELEESIRLFPPHCRTERDVVRRLVERPGAYKRAIHGIHPRLRSLYLSAWQSALFDKVLERRLDRFDRVMAGDLAFRHSNGACFLVEDVQAEQERADLFEISPSGPLFGSRMTRPQGDALKLEEEVMREEGVDPAVFDPALRLEGERRPLRVPLTDAEIGVRNGELHVSFSLPRGAYATSVLREIMKGG